MDSLLRGCCNGTNGGPAMNRMSMLTIGIAAGSDATVPGRAGGRGVHGEKQQEIADGGISVLERPLIRVATEVVHGNRCCKLRVT